MGVVNHSVPQNAEGDAAFQRALSLAEEIIPNGPVGVRMAKIAVNRGSDVDINTGLAIEENCYAQVRTIPLSLRRTCDYERQILTRLFPRKTAWRA